MPKPRKRKGGGTTGGRQKSNGQRVAEARKRRVRRPADETRRRGDTCRGRRHQGNPPGRQRRAGRDPDRQAAGPGRGRPKASTPRTSPATGPRSAAARPIATSRWATAPIGSPIVEDATIVVAMNEPSYQAFSPLLRKGSTLVVNSSLVPSVGKHPGVKIVSLELTKIAADMGSLRSANMLVFGLCAGLLG